MLTYIVSLFLLSYAYTSTLPLRTACLSGVANALPSLLTLTTNLLCLPIPSLLCLHAVYTYSLLCLYTYSLLCLYIATYIVSYSYLVSYAYL